MKNYKPTTPSQRSHIGLEYRNVLTAQKPHKALTTGFQRPMGRNSDGRITTRHKGGGNKRRYREIDFVFGKKGIPARIESIEYDPNRSAFIALVLYDDGERRYVLAGKSTKVGQKFIVSESAPLEAGNRTVLKRIPVGTFVHSVELQPNGGAKIARSAGNFVEVVANAEGQAFLKMPSGEVRKVSEMCWATIGQISNEEFRLRSLGKAGRSRWLGIRPTVRGTAMNPVDHPYGGGEGRQGRGLRRAKSLWGKPTGGVKSRRAKKYSNVFIVSRRKTAREKRR